MGFSTSATSASAGSSLPSGGIVTKGQAVIGQAVTGTTGSAMTITQSSQRAIIDWQNFSIGAGNVVSIQNGNGATLNRVTGGQMSRIDGGLTATGSVYLINPQGVVIGKTGTILTGGSFLASTLDIADDAFMKGGTLQFQGSGGTVENHGTITAGGDVFLIARTVASDGAISAANGTVGLASGASVLIRDKSENERVFVELPLAGGSVTAEGAIAAVQAELKAAGGNVYALAGNSGPVIRATGTAERGGRVWLTATGGNVTISGEIDAQNRSGSGGIVTATADNVSLTADAKIDASGNSNGGRVFLGGDVQGGKDPSRDLSDQPIATAQTVSIAAGAQVTTDGKTGNGGSVVVWSDQVTTMQGSISAKGAAGHGGFVETSSAKLLNVNGTVLVGAASGHGGQWLLDPSDITISSAADANITGASPFGSTGPASSNLSVASLLTALNGGGTVTVDASTGAGGLGTITVASAIAFTGTTAATLVLNGPGGVAINQAISSANTTLGLTVTTTNKPVTIGANITTNGGALSVTAGTGGITNTGTINTGAGALSLSSLGGSISNSGTLTSAAVTGAAMTLTASTGTLTNSGMISVTGAGTMGVTATGGITNNVGGTITTAASAATLTANAGGLTNSATISSTGTGLMTVTATGGAISNTSTGTLTTAATAGTGLTLTVGAGSVTNSGTISTTGAATVSISATNGTVTNNSGATLNASGANLGISVGTGSFTNNGLMKGGSAARITTVTATTGAINILADPTTGAGSLQFNASGGTISVQSNITTNGGYIHFNAGASGTTLLGGAAAISLTTKGGDVIFGNPTTIGAGGDTINTTGGATGNGNIQVASAVTYSSPGAATINWSAGNDIYLNKAVTSTGGALTMNFATVANVGGVVDLANLTSNGGNITFNGPAWLGGNGAALNLATNGGALAFNSTVTVGTAGGVTLDTTGGAGGGNITFASTIDSGDDYQLVTTLTSWQTARTNDKSGVGNQVGDTYLATITTLAENSRIGGVTATTTGLTVAWLGAETDPTNSANRNSWYWVTGPEGLANGGDGATTWAGTLFYTKSPTTSYSFTNWNTGEPNNSASNEWAAVINYAANHWNDLSGATNAASVKEINLAGTAITLKAGAGASGGIVSFGGNIGTIKPIGNLTVASAKSVSFGAGSTILKSDGSINIPQAVTATSLGITAGGSVSLINTANQIATISGITSAGTTAIVDARALTISGAVSVTGAGLSIQVAGGNLTLGASASVTTTGTGNDIVLATDQNFANNATLGSAALSAGGRYITYDTSPVTSIYGGLNGLNLYGQTYGANPPASITQTGNLRLHSVTPTLTLTADDLSRIYGSANPTLTGTWSGLIGGDTIGVAISGTASLSTGATSASNVGGYAITAANGTLVSNQGYLIAFAPGTLTVTKAPLTITADNQSRLYGSSNPTLTASYSGLVNGDASGVVSGLTIGTLATSASNVGTYGITLSGGSASNYAITLASGTLTVTKAPLTITADDQSRIYGSSNPSLTASYSGLVNGDASGVVSGLTIGTTATSASNVGAYGITLSGASASNYAITLTSGTLTVTKAPLTITADDQSRIYGSSNPTLTASYSGLVNGDTASAVSGLTFGTTATSASNVGTYGINLSGASAGNYSITLASGTLTVTKAPLTITADNQSRIYGSANPTLTASYSGLVNGDAGTVVSGLTFGTTATAASNVGIYGITLSGGSANNYSITLASGTLTVTKAPLTITADNQSRIYGSANPSLTASYAGLVNGDASSVVSGLTIGTSATSASNVGAYGITLSGGAASNYSITLASGTLTVTKAPLTITADDQSRIYGSANPTLTASYSGLVNGDTSGVVSGLGFGTTATSASNVGNYGITLSGGSASNYAITLASGTLSVTKAPLTITADNQSRIYGSANPTLTASYSGLVNGDAGTVVSGLGFGTTATSASNVGNYGIILSGGSASNYSITLASGTLSVTKAPLTITADNQSRIYGSANPSLTASYSGLVNGDGSAVVSGLGIGTAATSASNVGGYTITLSGGAASNYSITLASGTLSVTKAPLTITANNASHMYGTANPSFTASYGGLVNGDTSAVVSGLGFTAPGSGVNVGSYALTPTGAAASNYSISYSAGTLSVTKAPLTITAGNQTRLYGSSNRPFTVTYGGLVNGDGASAVSGLSFGTTATAGSNVGTYAIGLSGASAANYTLTLVPGTLTINPVTLTITADDQLRYYGNPNPALTAHYSGFVLGQNSSVLTGTLTFTTAAVPGSAVGSYAITVGGVTAPANYTLVFRDGMLTVQSLTVPPTVVTGPTGSTSPTGSPTTSGLPYTLYIGSIDPAEIAPALTQIYQEPQGRNASVVGPGRDAVSGLNFENQPPASVADTAVGSGTGVGAGEGGVNMLTVTEGGRFRVFIEPGHGSAGTIEVIRRARVGRPLVAVSSFDLAREEIASNNPAPVPPDAKTRPQLVQTQ